MELQGLYELHERLGAAAVAGVNLIGDDFRLRRAVEQIRPLAQAVPVIKKLYTMAENVMAPDCEDRPGLSVRCPGPVRGPFVYPGRI